MCSPARSARSAASPTLKAGSTRRPASPTGDCTICGEPRLSGCRISTFRNRRRAGGSESRGARRRRHLSARRTGKAEGRGAGDMGHGAHQDRRAGAGDGMAALNFDINQPLEIELSDAERLARQLERLRAGACEGTVSIPLATLDTIVATLRSWPRKRTGKVWTPEIRVSRAVWPVLWRLSRRSGARDFRNLRSIPVNRRTPNSGIEGKRQI